jgi:hypothetical protein
MIFLGWQVHVVIAFNFANCNSVLVNNFVLGKQHMADLVSRNKQSVE